MFLPEMAKGLDSKKLTLHIGDGFEFLRSHQNEFDVILCDSSDSKGKKDEFVEKYYLNFFTFKTKLKAQPSAYGKSPSTV